ncbi:hypothetical protein X275_05545 [Marinitoga sp. 1197]|uniref:hypothetical protein n=1 Tax=Marinitoga sp. 1197 TaxID=1428449 RepID=UPI0006410904|nr:hypothetical protein [Marinitoga sp. 1197]KLO22750.1 hypothetical protein X275_05545 [Marinitoga sp. 1197]
MIKKEHIYFLITYIGASYIFVSFVFEYFQKNISIKKIIVDLSKSIDINISFLNILIIFLALFVFFLSFIIGIFLNKIIFKFLSISINELKLSIGILISYIMSLLIGILFLGIKINSYLLFLVTNFVGIVVMVFLFSDELKNKKLYYVIIFSLIYSINIFIRFLI